MNILQHMDKQQQMMDLMNRLQPQQPQPQEQIVESSSGRIVNGDYYTGTKEETLTPSYDLQNAVSVPNMGSMAYPDFRSAGILEPQGLTEMRQREERTVSPSYGAVTLAEIDRTVKKYTDNLLYALEGVSVRLSQLESRAHLIESFMADLNLAVGNYTRTKDGRLLQFEKILHEVQSGVQILRDKQEIIKPPPPPRGGYQQSTPHDHQPQLPTPSAYTSYSPNPTSQPPQGPPPYMQQPPPGSGSLHRPFLIPPPPPLLTSAMYNQPPASVRSGWVSPSYISSGTVGSGGDRYEKLPIAKVLPKAAPVARAGSGSTGNHVPLGDVVEKIAMMGFSREQVRDTARKLTENGQDVDLNVVLDKLMNGGGAGGDTIIQPRKGWFSR